jgi:hypothetical protein
MIAKKVGLWLTILGILPYALLQTWILFEPLNWKLLEYPVSLRSGSITSPEFTTKRLTSYLILLEFDYGIDPQRMNCLLGIRGFYEECQDIPEAVDVSWRLMTDGRSNGDGSSKDKLGELYNDTINKVIGRFDARKGQRHVVLLNVRRDGRDLDSTNPRLVVLGYSKYGEGAMFLLQFTFYGAVLVSGTGLILVCVSFFARGVRRNR